jgi:N-acyl-D-amino-acid deacylase
MPRFLGHYVRDLQLIPIEQAVRKMTSLPAQCERLLDRGVLREGYFADITVFDPGWSTDGNPARLLRGAGWKPME